ncbi:MAG: cytochrome-c oxidase, cbb3-type subunit III [Gammaproteobacteria bacterium]|nr:MAG: cytochrome-c oxidase, cbb3-type subunit III [Gammaproteobacteria bacterium]
MSPFWSWFVIILTVGSILATWWLIRWTMKISPGEAGLGEETGHVWDGDLREYNNPLPRWWLWLFYITIVFSVIYLILYPGLGNFPGLLGWTKEKQYEEEVRAAEAKYGPIYEKYAKMDIPALAKDPEAMKIGQRLFLNYCATCHGADAGGAPGFPNLTDNDWLWGGDPQTIEKTILDGRQGSMPAWKDALGEEGIEQVAAYVMSLSGRKVDPALAEKGKEKYMTFCIGCHGPDGKGNPALGAPNLTDNIWLYGGSPGTIKKSIREGRNGVMPPHRDFLGEAKVHILAAYVYSLSHKE